MNKTKIDIEQKKIERSAKLHWVHWCVLILSFIATFFIWQYSSYQVNSKKKLLFDKQAQQAVELISERLRKYEDALWAGVAAIHSQSHGIDNKEWERFSTTLEIEKRYHGINGIGIIYKVNKEEKNKFLKAQRKYNSKFKIHPEHNRGVLYPITYIEPLDSNIKALGLDMAHEDNRFNAVIKAKNTGKAQITGPITLVQSAEPTPGFLFYAPFYKNFSSVETTPNPDDFIGMVYAPFIVKNLMAGTLQKSKRQVGIKISDGNNVLYNENDIQDTGYDPNPEFKNKKTLNHYGRSWSFEIQTNKSFTSTNKSNQPFLILAGGITIDALLFTLFTLLTRANKRSLNFSRLVSEKYKNNLQKISENKRFQDLVFNQIPDFIFVKDENFKIIQANDSFINVYPKNRRDKIIGSTTFEEYSEDEAAEFLKNDKDAIENGENICQETISFPDGNRRTLLTRKIGFDKGGKRYLLGVSTDITILKDAEKEILRSNAELERFAYIASHDLQEPLRMVSNFTALLQDEYKSVFDEQAETYMKFVLDGTYRMQNLISDLLEYSRVGQEEAGAQWVQGNSCLKQAIQNLSGSIKTTSTKITYDELPEFYIMPINLIRIFQNLIGNAIKYRDENRSPIIHVSLAEDNPKEWVIGIEDNSVGIKKEYLEQVFVLFKRLENRQKSKGTGIGLSICKKIIEVNGGSIWVTSREGKGSKFFFTIPKNEKKEIL